MAIKEKSLTIIIPVKNEGDNFKNLIHCLHKQDYSNFDIIAAGEFSDKNQYIFCKKNSIKVIDGGLPGKGRNCGANLTNTKYFMFLDADVKINNTFVNQALYILENRNYDAISFNFFPDTNDFLINALFCIGRFYFKFQNFLGFSRGIGGGILIKREIHEKINGFDESIKIGEDLDYIRRIAKRFRYSFVSEPYIFVSARRFLNEGSINLFLKYMFIELHRIILGEIRSNIIKYF